MIILIFLRYVKGSTLSYHGNGKTNGSSAPPHPSNGSNGHAQNGGKTNGGVALAVEKPLSNQTVAAPPISRQPLPENWCSIAYFELDTQVSQMANLGDEGGKGGHNS